MTKWVVHVPPPVKPAWEAQVVTDDGRHFVRVNEDLVSIEPRGDAVSTHPFHVDRRDLAALVAVLSSIPKEGRP